MVWNSIIFTFCLIKSRSHDQSECTNISSFPEINRDFRFLYCQDDTGVNII